jgi:hypothetical protein
MHRYLRKAECSSFIMCLLLVLPLPRVFLQEPQTVLTRQSRQAVCAINQSIFNMMSMARWQYHAIDKLVCFVNVFQRKYSTDFKVLVPSCNLIANEASLYLKMTLK